MATSRPVPRKDRFTALDALAVARELRTLERARVDKAFDAPLGGASIVLRTAGEGRRELIAEPGRFAALLEPSTSHPESPGPLARELRRVLAGARLTDCREPNGERVLHLVFQRADAPEPFDLILELFAPGNLFVVHAGKLVVVATPRRFASRQVRVGLPFVPAPARPDPFGLPAGAIASLLRESTADLASTLAARVGFGGPIAEELIARAGLSPVDASSLAPDASGAAIAVEAARLEAEIGDAPKGFLYLRGDEPWDATAYESRRWADDPRVGARILPTFSGAAAEYFPRVVAAVPKATESDSARASQERQLRQQRAAIASLEQEARSRLEQAEAIYTHYPEVEARLARARDHGEAETVELELEGLTVPLRRGRPIEESVQVLYGEAKRAQARLAGARAALADTEHQLASAPENVARVETTAPEASRRRAHWFERFRWFIASGGEIVVGGRDAGSNDVVVRKYLKAQDRYVHADLHGAASVVVKHRELDGGRPSPESMREAGQWAVAYSKAWRAGLASASAFWVSADQVSKSAGSGEFVARGSWVITGRKNFLTDLPLELAIGKIAFEREELWSVAPVSALQSRGEVRFLLTPGEERGRSGVEVELSSALGIPRDRLQAWLPAGGLSVRRA